MAHQAAGFAWIEHHGHALRFCLARIEPRYRALAGGSADRCGGLEVGGMQRRGVIVILLHAGAVAGDRGHGNGMPRADGGAVKAVARHQHHAADPGRRRGAARFGDAGNAEPGRFGLPRPLFQHFHRGHVGIEQVEIGERLRQQRRIGEAGEFVLGRRARHGDGPLGQAIDAVAADVIGRDRRLLVADDDAQADIVAFGALRFLDRAVAYIDRERNRTHGDRVGFIGAGAARGRDQAAGEIGEGGLIEERGHFRFATGLWGESRRHKGRWQDGETPKM